VIRANKRIIVDLHLDHAIKVPFGQLSQ